MTLTRLVCILGSIVSLAVVLGLVVGEGTITVSLNPSVKATSPIDQVATPSPIPTFTSSPEPTKTLQATPTAVLVSASPQPLTLGSIIDRSEKINCKPDSSSDELIAQAWDSLANGVLDRALACSRKVINDFSVQADMQQRQLGPSIPDDHTQYPELNDVGTAWFITGRALVDAAMSADEGKAIPASEKKLSTVQLGALAAYQLVINRYPGAYALYPTREGHWPVHQAAFCRSYQLFPDPAAQLPTVYTDHYHFSDCYASPGLMSDDEQYDTSVDMNWRENPHRGETCIRIVYSPKSGEWEGAYLQFPSQNWGQEPGLDLSRASSLTFWARGETGRESVEFKIGGISTGKYKDSVESTLGTVELGSEWRRYTIDFSEQDSSSVIGAFAWVTPRAANPSGATFYLDDIVFVESNDQ